ncbi:MAG: glycine zipper 2TM domain-containing protein [Pandoraea sp.]|nr:glycine zipper 2TM domain-containing protein [Pandoraea sp.]MDR3399493.1 glycine zipper 2TM domain-containing protein [Pandoraea sp.]
MGSSILGCTLGGAAAGGVIGHEATGGSTAGTVGGAVVGGVIGHELGK